jgi:hypothetical protein
MAPTSCFTGQVHRLPDAPETYGPMITRPKAAPAQSRSANRGAADPPDCDEATGQPWMAPLRRTTSQPSMEQIFTGQ